MFTECDAAHCPSRAATYYSKIGNDGDQLQLAFCTHHSSKLSEKLRLGGWIYSLVPAYIPVAQK